MAWEDDTIEWLKRPFNKQSDATTLDLIQKLFKIQSGRNAPQKAMIEFTELLNELAAPETPTSYRALLKVVEEVCLPNTTKIHVCVNDCIAFYNSKFDPSYQFAGEQWEQCPECGEDRYQAGTRQPRKVFYYVPLRDHVDSVFCRSALTKALLRTKQGGLPTGGDMHKIWRDITDSLGWDAIVHRDDPSFGDSVRKSTLATSMFCF
jgi:hypothetical protein